MLNQMNIFLSESAPSGGLPSWIMWVFLGLIIVAFYFLAIRPQKKQEQEVKAMRDGLCVGDEITTIGGIIGKIVSIKEETCMIETGRDKTRIRILKSAVRCVDVPAEAERAAVAAQKAAEAAAAAEAAEAAEAAAPAGKKGKKKKKADKSAEASANVPDGGDVVDETADGLGSDDTPASEETAGASEGANEE